MADPRLSLSQNFEMDDEVQNLVVTKLNEASLSSDTEAKISLLTSVQTMLLESAPLMDAHIHDLLAFQNDRNADIRKFIINFIEEAVKKDSEWFPSVITSLSNLLQDKTPQVQKRVVQCLTQLYRLALRWISKAITVTEKMFQTWNALTSMKGFIINMVDSDNDGLRTQIIKFLEVLVLLQTYPDSESLKRDDFTLEDVPLTLKVIRRRKLEEEAMTFFDLLIKFHGSQHITSANLMACMGTLTNIAKQRPMFTGKVINALETLHMNLPPTLSTSQVNSVRKHLKMQLLNLLRHPSSTEFHTNITTLLTDLGATTHEVMKALPKIDEMKKRTKKQTSEVPAKKPRVEEGPLVVVESAVDITESFIIERLSPELAANLVVMGMTRLPDTMPSHFSATYTPIAAAGTQGQIKHVARLLATQINNAGLGPGASIAKSHKNYRPVEDDEEEDTNVVMDEDYEDDGKNAGKILKLESIKPLTEELREILLLDSVLRILQCEESSMTGGVGGTRCKILANLAASSSPNIRETILNYILADLRGQISLALSWVYEEYSFMQGFSKRSPIQMEPDICYNNQYNNLVTILINYVINNKEMKDREAILSRICLEMPLITKEVIDLLKQFSTAEVLGLNIINQIILLRPPHQKMFLAVLLENSSHQTAEIREASISHIVDLYAKDENQTVIEKHAVYYLCYLTQPNPPESLFGMSKGRAQLQANWTDEAIKACLYLYLSLLPINQGLIHELARVYVQTTADVKRTILRVVEHPVKAMGMDSPELLKLVEDCPKGSETLVTRLIYILTDKVPPSAELVARVRDLYHTRVSDVRCLIPVLNGLSKNEVISALPKLIKLKPNVVQEVFNRLLSSTQEGSHVSPISPSELLIALHLIDPSKCELKAIIKATSICFADKQAYTQETLAVVMQHLMEVTPLPTLLMRTVIQALSLYPRLIGFVMNILQRLILKQVWRQKKVWEGFIKCCQRAQPHSFQVLLQLPAPQLADVFNEAPDLKKPLLDHIMEFTENQRAHIPKNIMDILLGSTPSTEMEFLIKEEPASPPPDLMIDIKEEPIDDIPRHTYAEPAPPGMD